MDRELCDECPTISRIFNVLAVLTFLGKCDEEDEVADEVGGLAGIFLLGPVPFHPHFFFPVEKVISSRASLSLKMEDKHSVSLQESREYCVVSL